jgi:aromatase
MSCIKNEIVIRATPERIYSTVSHLGNWPVILPHYRWIQPLPDGSVKMAARRGTLPVRWTSWFRADPERKELHFEHIRALTRGMKVRWTIVPIGDEESRVTIEHDLTEVRKRLGSFLADVVIARFFIDHVARRTLHNFKKHIESK